MSSSSSNNLSVSDIVNAKIVDLLLDCCRKTVMECSYHYNFDAQEALSKMGLLTDYSALTNLTMSNVNVSDNISDVSENSVKEVVKDDKSVSNNTKVLEEGKSDVKKVSSIPLPYNGTCDDSKCQALKLNHGLYTQCETKKVKESDYCKSCSKKEMLGTMKERMSVGIMEFKDSKGKGPTSYMKVLNKLKISKEEAIEEAKNKNIVLDSVHFEEEVKVKKVKVVKEKVVKVDVVNDVKVDVVNDVKVDVVVNEIDNNSNSSSKKGKGRPKKEKEVKEKQAKGRPKKEKKETETESAIDDLFANLVAKENESPSEKVDVVNKFDFQGTTYLKSKNTGIIYNMEQDAVGKWNENTSTIDFDDEEEEEEEYDE
jgi:hypothetical protein